MSSLSVDFSLSNYKVCSDFFGSTYTIYNKNEKVFFDFNSMPFDKFVKGIIQLKKNKQDLPGLGISKSVSREENKWITLSFQSILRNNGMEEDLTRDPKHIDVGAAITNDDL